MNTITWQKWSTFFTIYIGYAMIVMNRKCFVFALPAIMRDLKFTKRDAGFISTSQHISYMFSKLAGGIISDHVNSKYLFCFSLFFSGILCISLSAFETVSYFAAILFMQGVVQGGGWPSCTALVRKWFNASQYGTWFSIFNTCMNVACIIGPILVTFITSFEWSRGPFIVGIMTMLSFSLSIIMITDISNEKLLKDNQEDENILKGRGSWRDIFKSSFSKALCFSEFVIYLARTTLLEWMQLFIIYELHQDVYISSLFVSIFELGGIIGSISAGYISDKLVLLDIRSNKIRNSRLIVSIFYLLISITSLFFFILYSSSNSTKMFFIIFAFIIGLGIYGPMVLFGIMCIEAAPRHLAGTSQSIVALFGSVGNIASGIVFSLIAELTSWLTAFIVLEFILIFLTAFQIFALRFDYKMTPILKRTS